MAIAPGLNKISMYQLDLIKVFVSSKIWTREIHFFCFEIFGMLHLSSLPPLPGGGDVPK
jgi:hypothetical protein